MLKWCAHTVYLWNSRVTLQSHLLHFKKLSTQCSLSPDFVLNISLHKIFFVKKKKCSDTYLYFFERTKRKFLPISLVLLKFLVISEAFFDILKHSCFPSEKTTCVWFRVIQVSFPLLQLNATSQNPRHNREDHFQPHWLTDWLDDAMIKKNCNVSYHQFKTKLFCATCMKFFFPCSCTFLRGRQFRQIWNLSGSSLVRQCRFDWTQICSTSGWKYSYLVPSLIEKKVVAKDPADKVLHLRASHGDFIPHGDVKWNFFSSPRFLPALVGESMLGQINIWKDGRGSCGMFFIPVDDPE